MTDLTVGAAGRAISFGPFRLLPTQRLLQEWGKPVRLGSRALDIRSFQQLSGSWATPHEKNS